MTITGLVLLPLMLVVAMLPAGWLIAGLLVFPVFADASIANPGGRAVPVGWFFVLLLAGRLAIEMILGRTGLRMDILQRLVPLVLFIASCVLSLLVALGCFAGRVMVLPGSAGFVPWLAEPYRLMPENINQLAYLGLTLLLVYLSAHFASAMSEEERAIWIRRGMIASCGFASLVVAWHILSFSHGVWFPGDFFHSDVSSDAWDQGMGEDSRRPSGPFAEPSNLAYFYAMYVFYFWASFRLTGAFADEIFLLISLAVMVISTSTTAYMVLAMFAPLAVIDRMTGGGATAAPAERREPTIGLRQLVPILVFVLAVWGLVQFLLQNNDIVHGVIEDQIVNKGSSDSYEFRSFANQMALRILFDTYGLGIGLGSHRPSSGLLSLLIGPGVLGTLLFGLFVASVLRAPATAELARASKAIRWAALGPLVSHLMTVPDFQSLSLWSPLALALAMHLSLPRAMRSREVVHAATALPARHRQVPVEGGT